jgi:glycosyltransferase involved in cell wall biosynthesis
LVERLCDLRVDLCDLKSFHVILVDDGSSDDTWQVMHAVSSHLPWIERLRHNENRGITAAIMTGLRAAKTELVATLDSDCTYDPLQMRKLLTAVDNRVAMVTASPYHPQGAVLGVPRWRLFLSKAASTAYSVIINTDLHTYTSCFRIYRRSAFVDMKVQNEGFVGMAELLWMAVRSGGEVKEAPAVLTSRRVGYSKLKTLPVIAGHLRLFSQIIYQRFSRIT